MNPIRVLVVDDNPTNLKLAVSVLESSGYEILKATDAVQALAVIQKTPPDLILMDIALPGMDGLTLTRQLKANPATRHICVVALTAFAMRGDDEKAKAAGCDGYLTKPIDTRSIAQEIAEILERSGGIKERASENPDC
jgi:CheY-like chemotaxis protein